MTGSTVDLRQPHDVRSGGEFAEVAVFVILDRADQRACFDEAPWIDHLLDALANGVASTGMLTLDALGAA